MKVYVTKYAITKGVQEKEVEPSGVAATMVVCKAEGIGGYYHKPFWHLTHEEAVAHAEKMRLAKLASLHKQILYLENLRF